MAQTTAGKKYTKIPNAGLVVTTFYLSSSFLKTKITTGGS
jgi:hypothetical protein